jgi:Ca2+-binding EF-hand superfamily protein
MAEEYAQMYDRVGIPREAAAEAFRRLDRSGSGEIDHEEFRKGGLRVLSPP